MQDYQVFGGVLRSVLVWPELAQCPPVVSPDWILSRGEPVGLPCRASCLGTHHYADDVKVSLWSDGERWRVATSDIGDFDIAGDSRSIVWRATASVAATRANEELARFDILGRILPLVLHRGGAISLHGSAVVTPAGAILLLGAKGRGKSTLALALAQRGAPLLTDDVAVVEGGPDTSALVRPGVHAVRLWPDAAERLGTANYGKPGSIGRKLVVHTLPDALRASRTTPLAAVYIMEPAGPASAGAAPVMRDRLRQVDAVRQLLGQVTAGNLLGGEAAPVVLARVAELTRRAPVYLLRLHHDFARLGDAVSAVLGWHATAADTVEPA